MRTSSTRLGHSLISIPILPVKLYLFMHKTSVELNTRHVTVVLCICISFAGYKKGIGIDMKLWKKTLIIAACVIMLYPSATAAAANYTVVPKDSLYKISQLFKVPIDTIKKDNNLSTNTIYPGQVLNINSLEYTVKSGDSLFIIATRYGIPLANLRIANNKWDNLLIPGQKLVIPGAKTESQAQAVISHTQAEVDLLARLIEAEAAGEIYQAKVAVGGVVVNRVQSSEWPNSITSVIYQKIGEYQQFTPVKNGMINNKPSEDSLKAAKAALNGSDPSNGAMFYFDDSSTNQWLWSKTRTAYLDSMVFVK